MFLEHLQIEDLRAIRKLAVDFKTPDRQVRRWTVFLGENGCGKSTVLKAIGLVLAGSEALPRLLERPDEWIRNGAKRALISARLCTAQGETREVSLEIRRGERLDDIIKRNADGLRDLDAALEHAQRNYFIAGYGAFRRPPGGSNASRSLWEATRAANLGTLFTATTDLVGLEQWAIDFDYRAPRRARAVVAKALNTLLPGMKFKSIDKKRRAVVMSTEDGEVTLSNLSEGYQAMAAWAGDMLYRMTDTFEDRQDPLNARGLLLIDEMDLHLHPVWKRRFVEFLDAAFPRLQVIATTHSPLSVQDCGEGELFVIRREPDRGPVLVPFRGDPRMMRLSDLFLSPLIGLETLDSPKVASLRKDARDIELKAGPRTAAEMRKLDSISEQLRGVAPLAEAEVPAFSGLLKISQSRSATTKVLDQIRRDSIRIPIARRVDTNESRGVPGRRPMGVAYAKKKAHVTIRKKAKRPAKKK